MDTAVSSPIDLKPHEIYFDESTEDLFRIIKNNTVIFHNKGKVEGDLLVVYLSDPKHPHRIKATRIAEKICCGNIKIHNTNHVPTRPHTQHDHTGKKSSPKKEGQEETTNKEVEV